MSQATTARPSVADVQGGGGNNAPALPMGPKVNSTPQRSEPGALLGGRIVSMDTFPVADNEAMRKNGGTFVHALTSPPPSLRSESAPT